jgi:hypothetical protein
MGNAKKFALKCGADDKKAQEVQKEMFSYVTTVSSLTAEQTEITFQMSSRDYWYGIGGQKFPALFEVAKPIIEMLCSSATAERTWSIFKFIHSGLRNRLTNERVQKLVFIYTNCVLMDDQDKGDYIKGEGAEKESFHSSQ